MKNLYQQMRFDFPMMTTKFLCINYPSIQYSEIYLKIHHTQLLNWEIIKSLGRWFQYKQCKYTYLILFILQTKTIGWKRCVSQVIQFKHQSKSLHFRCIN